jgi:hypothetical protein
VFYHRRDSLVGSINLQPSIDLGVEERRIAIEAIATLVHIKSTLGELLLKPAGVPLDVVNLLYLRDDVTGRAMSKRMVAPLILNELEKRTECSGVIRAIIDIAAHWSHFHLADNEFQARATVQKAREMMGTIEEMEAREARQRELAREAAAARVERERFEGRRKHNELLLLMFDEMARNADPHQRGYLLQELLNRLFDLHGIHVIRSFQRNHGAEQIDGAFKIEGWHYLAECRWRQKPADCRDLDGLVGQVNRSGKQTMGLFLSINGWSEHVIPLLQQNPSKSIILMEGHDLRTVMSASIDLRGFIAAKLAKLNFECLPFLGVNEYLREQSKWQSQ